MNLRGVSLVTLCAVLLYLPLAGSCFADGSVKVGVTSVLSGDLGVLGQNVVDTVETYRRHYLRHPIEFYYEDAKLSSTDGLKSYQKLINGTGVDMIIGACTSNGTMAAKALINSSKTPTITVVTGGHNIDQAGPYVFRIGNSDTLNGIQEAESFFKSGVRTVALLTEETEYTQDISKFFRSKFLELKGTLVYDQSFVPGAADFRTEISVIKKKSPEGIFVLTQTGTALGVFLKQWDELGGERGVQIHTTFVAAPNPDAHEIAGALLDGVYYMSPEYDRDNPRLQEFFARYREDHGKDPSIAFHTAGTVDSLDLLQLYLDKHAEYSKEGLREFLLTEVKHYTGLMGRYSFDEEGNADLGFSMARISKEDNAHMH